MTVWAIFKRKYCLHIVNWTGKVYNMTDYTMLHVIVIAIPSTSDT